MMKCFGRLCSHRFSRGDELFGLVSVDVSVSLAVCDPVSNTRMVSSLLGLLTGQQSDSTEAARAHPSLAARHKILRVLFHILLLLHLSGTSDIFGHEPVLQHLLSLISHDIPNIVGLGEFPCEVSDLATTSASERLGKPPFSQVHLHGRGSR
jgi:hypothetical protein